MKINDVMKYGLKAGQVMSKKKTTLDSEYLSKIAPFCVHFSLFQIYNSNDVFHMSVKIGPILPPYFWFDFCVTVL